MKHLLTLALAAIICLPMAAHSEASPTTDATQAIALTAAEHFHMPTLGAVPPVDGSAELYLPISPVATSPHNYVKCALTTANSSAYRCGLYFTRWVIGDDILLAEAECSKNQCFTITKE